MKLREFMRHIIRPYGPFTQTEAEKKLGIPQWKLSNWKNASDDSDYEKNWQDFLTIMAISKQLNIDPTNKLSERSEQQWHELPEAERQRLLKKWESGDDQQRQTLTDDPGQGRPGRKGDGKRRK